MNEITKKVLLRAAELVERGWCQYALGTRSKMMDAFWSGETRISYQVPINRPHGLLTAERVCLDGALMLAVHEVTGHNLEELAQSSAYRDARDVMTDAVHARSDGSPSYVIWNDRSDRTAEEVAALCRKVAE